MIETLLPTIVVTPIRQGVPSTGGKLEVLVRVQAPQVDLAAISRSKLRLALVVDRSGSMSGEPLREALRCVDHIVDRLHPSDEVAVVLYDNHVRVAVPLQPAANRSAIHASIAGVESGGNTALFDGWRTGAEQLGGGPAGTLSRVLLLSDGQANHGPSTLGDIAPHCAQWLAQGVGTTTVGLGRGFNEDLMMGMSRAGGGQAYYGQTAEDLHDSFDEELALLEALFLRMLRIKAAAGEGVIVEGLSLVTPANADGWMPMSDLPWGAESWLLLRLHVTPAPASGGAPRPLVAITLEATRKDGTQLQATAPLLALPVVSPEAFAALPDDELVARRLKEVEFGQASARAREMMIDGEYEQALEFLQSLQAKVADQPWLVDKLAHLLELAQQDREMTAKELRYKTSRLASRVAAVHEAAYRADETNAMEMPAYLRRKSSEGKGRKH